MAQAKRTRCHELKKGDRVRLVQGAWIGAEGRRSSFTPVMQLPYIAPKIVAS